MRNTSDATKAQWASGDYVGASRPMVRATIQHLQVMLCAYGKQTYSSVPFGQASRPLELPNIKDVKWSRSVDTPVASMTMTLYNTEPLPLGTAPLNGDLDQPGYYSSLRGTTAHADRWGRTPNGWQGWLVPDRIIRCVDTETEILTKRGWLAWDQVTEGDETLGINPAIGNAEWQSIVEVFRAPFAGELTRLKSRAHDSLTTGNHRWLTLRNGKFDWRTTDTLDRHSYIPLAASQAEEDVASYSDDFVELAAWYYTEGTADHRLRGLDSGGSISQSETVNPQNCERIRNLLFRMYGLSGSLPRGKYVPQETVDEAIRLRQQGMAVRDIAGKLGVSNTSVYRWANGKRSNTKVYKWRDGQTRPGQKCFAFTQEVARDLRKVICGPDKVPSPEFLVSLTQSQLRLFIDVSILGDGTGLETFIQNDVRVSAFEFACALAGRPTHTKRHGSCRAVTLLRRSVTSPHDAVYQEDRRANGVAQESYEGHVWCPRVKHGNWLARRNGCVFYTGNTYEGYGFDPTVAPEVDPHLYASGVWRIDDVTFSTDGTITIACRDIGSVLLDQILFPPIVPFAYYPVWFETAHPVKNPDIVTSVGGWTQPAYDTSSNKPYVGNSGSVSGHVGPDAFDTNSNSYWLSIGNAHPDADFAFEYIQGKFSARLISGGQFRVWGGPYTCYVSVYANGGWHGSQTVPYNPNDPISAPNGANVRFLMSLHVDSEETVSFKLPSPIAGATKVRLCFTNLCNSGIGPYVYRAGVRSFKVTGSVSHSSPGGTHLEPRRSPPAVRDYTDIVKILAAWGGFYWPREAKAAFKTYSNAAKIVTVAPSNDPALVKGRVWGDLEQTGTSPLVAMPVSTFDKIPISDGIQKIADIVGFIWFIDETGAIVFRSPNIWKVGNWVGTGGPHTGRVTTVVTIDERTTLMSLSAMMSGRNIREKIFVANVSGRIAAMANGHNPYPSGLRRVGGWSDMHFLTTRECQIMADLISLRQLFTYRTDKVTIPGNPAIQCDDQVRIYERISEEVYLHYVIGVSMTWSVETGKYTYDLDTHWLGDTAFSNWTFNPANLSREAQTYLRQIGKIP